ncbi:MAG: glycosyltransferase family 4 protein [Alphaproteobacteria bacterium]
MSKALSSINLIKVIHLIPYDGIGGVEVAANSIPAGIVAEANLSINRYYIAKKSAPNPHPQVKVGPFMSEYNPLNYLVAAFQIARQKPDILVTSLWRSYLVGIIVKLVRPSTKLVTFLHLAKSMHSADAALTAISLKLSSQAWADSEATLQNRLKRRIISTRKISFLTNHITAPDRFHLAPSFIFWGRLHAQKNIKRALNIFSAIQSKIPNAKFMIIGPDGGERTKLEALTSSLGIDAAVTFSGALAQEEIFELAKDYTFFLQTSDVEGMSMSVVEAMQLGLIPLVTPVGEIGAYVTNGKSGILIRDDDQAITSILTLLKAAEKCASMSQNAVAYWKNQALYRADFIEACRSLVTISKLNDHVNQ